MLSFLDPLARRLMRRGLRRGLLEGSVVWIAVAAIAGLFHLLVQPERPRIAREDLALGESLIVTHVRALDPPRRSRAARSRPARSRSARSRAAQSRPARSRRARSRRARSRDTGILVAEVPRSGPETADLSSPGDLGRAG